MIMSEIKMMFRLLRASAKSQVMYRADFMVGLIGTLLYNGTFLISVGVLASRFGSIGGYSAGEIVLLFALFEVAHGLYGFFLQNMATYLNTLVMEGRLDIFFLRPYGILTQLNGMKMNYTAYVDLVIGLVALMAAYISLGEHWGIRWLLVPVFAVSGALIEFALALLMNWATVLWPNTQSFYGAYYQLITMGQRYPLNIFGKGFMTLLTFIFPLGFMNYYPMLCLMGRKGGWMGYFAPIMAGLFTAMAIHIFHTVLKRYTSTGN